MMTEERNAPSRRALFRMTAGTLGTAALGKAAWAQQAAAVGTPPSVISNPPMILFIT